jgi:hypothetical protein
MYPATKAARTFLRHRAGRIQGNGAKHGGQSIHEKPIFSYCPAMIAITGFARLGAGRKPSLKPAAQLWSPQAAQEPSPAPVFRCKIPRRGAGDELDHLIDSFNRMTGTAPSEFRADPPFFDRCFA